MSQNGKQVKSAIPQCSFCGKSQSQTNRFIAGPGETYICNECIDLYREHIEKMAEGLTTTKLSHVCTSCGTRAPASHRYCYNCGTQFPQET